MCNHVSTCLAKDPGRLGPSKVQNIEQAEWHLTGEGPRPVGRQPQRRHAGQPPLRHQLPVRRRRLLLLELASCWEVTASTLESVTHKRSVEEVCRQKTGAIPLLVRLRLPPVMGCTLDLGEQHEGHEVCQ